MEHLPYHSRCLRIPQIHFAGAFTHRPSMYNAKVTEAAAPSRVPHSCVPTWLAACAQW